MYFQLTKPQLKSYSIVYTNLAAYYRKRANKIMMMKKIRYAYVKKKIITVYMNKIHISAGVSQKINFDSYLFS
jgi:hypothetical protein